MTAVLAIDAMGGDFAPESVIEGCALALKSHKHVRFEFFGDEGKIKPLLEKHPKLSSKSKIIHTDHYIPSDLKPSLAIRQGKGSSMRMAIEAVRDNHADAVVSCGNTGAYMALTKMVLKTLPGIHRPVLGGLAPSLGGDKVFLDLGANIECSEDNLIQFAIMGQIFAQDVLKIKKPSVGLLNIGSEDLKGHAFLQNTHQILKESELFPKYVGFVEGNNIMGEGPDVIVADGFSGNIAVKSCEGAIKFYTKNLITSFRKTWYSKIAGLIAKPVFNHMKKVCDPRRVNGAPFLGLNGIAVKSHGGSDEVAFASAVGVAIDMAERKINDHIKDELSKWSHYFDSDKKSDSA